MLVLDEIYTGALLRQSAIDGYTSHISNRDILYKDPTTAKLLQKGLNKNIRQEVLWDLLLFFPAICYPFDNLDVTPLKREGLIGEPNCTFDRGMAFNIVNKNPEAVLLFEQYILYELKKIFGTSINNTKIKEYVSFAKDNDLNLLYRNNLACAGFSDYESFKKSQRDLIEATFDIFKNIPRSNSIKNEKDDELLFDISEDDFLLSKSLEYEIKIAESIEEIAKKWYLITELAHHHNATLKAKSPKAKPSKKKSSLSVTDGSKSVIKIWLSEIETLPRIESIDDVLRLREDPRINNFKEAILSWCDTISEGSIANEQKLRKSIRTANKELEKVANAIKISGWATVLCLPIDIAIIATGIPLATSPIGIGFYLYEKIKKKKYDWVMFGR